MRGQLSTWEHTEYMSTMSTNNGTKAIVYSEYAAQKRYSDVANCRYQP